MSRRTSGFSRRTSSSPIRNTTTAQRPIIQPTQRYAPAPSQTQSRGGIMSGLGGMIMSGMAFGAGSEIAHSAIRSVTGQSSHNNTQQPAESQQQQQQQYNQSNQQTQLCGDEMSNFTTCLKSQSQISMCQPYLDVLKECQLRYNLQI